MIFRRNSSVVRPLLLGLAVGLGTAWNAAAIIPNSLPDFQVGSHYSATLTWARGTGTITWQMTGNPAWLALTPNGKTATLSGDPTGPGSYNLALSATSPTGRASLFCTITGTGSAPLLTITTTSLPAATVNVPYQQTISASGGTRPYAFALAAGNLPGGLSLATGGVLSGTPTLAGLSTFTVKVTDASNGLATQQYSVTVNPAQTQLTVSCPAGSGQVGVT